MNYRVFRSRNYKEWHKNLTTKERRIIDSRIDIFVLEGLLIQFKQLRKEANLYEFKWVSGLRVYFSLLEDQQGNFMLLLQGGNKNSQDADITKAKNTLFKTLFSLNRKKNEKA